MKKNWNDNFFLLIIKTNIMDTIKFTPEKVISLKKEYKKAVDSNQETFMFDGKELVVGYAKYLIEYLDSVLKTM